MNKTGVLKVYLIGTRRFAYRLHFKRAKVPDWVTTAMNSIGDATIGFEDSTEETTDPGAGLIGESNPGDPNEATEDVVQDWEDAPANYGDLEVGELDEAIRVLEEADYQANAEEELREQTIETRARADPERFQTEMEADRYAEYVAMGWREPEPQDIGKVVFNRNHKRTDANLIRARATLRPDMLAKLEGRSKPTSISTKP